MFKLGKVLQQLMNMNKELEETRKEVHVIADSLGCHETFTSNYDVRVLKRKHNGKVTKVKVGFKNYDKENWANDPQMLDIRKKELELRERQIENSEW